MLQFRCGCGKEYEGKNGGRKLNEHIAKKKYPTCGPRHPSDATGSGTKTAERAQKTPAATPS